MARPMVMYQNDHPIQWTPAYVGGKVTFEGYISFKTIVTQMCSLQADSFVKNKGGQLMTSVTTPVFDRRNRTVCLPHKNLF